jgi:hypothetical protein
MRQVHEGLNRALEFVAPDFVNQEREEDDHEGAQHEPYAVDDQCVFEGPGEIRVL